MATDDLTCGAEVAGAASASPNGVDFDLHGYVGIRLLDATPLDVAKVARQLGPLQRPLQREPDVTVKFVDHLETGGPLTFAGWDDTGFDEEAFYLLRGKGNVRGKTRIPFQDVGGQCHIVCERTLPAVPLLLAIVNFTALAKGLLPLHASAFVHDGTGVVATGWAKGGKTETLLAFMSHGARYVGDEWVYISRERDMFGVPEPIRLWRWQLRQLAEIWDGLPSRDRRRMSILHGLARAVERMDSAGDAAGIARSGLRRLTPVLQRQVYVQVPPVRLFGSDAIALHGTVDQVVLVASHDASDVVAQSVEGHEVARRMLASLDDERAPFMAYYRQFRYAFPDLTSTVVDNAAELERDALHAVLDGVEVSWVRHPYPVDIERLYQTVLDLLSRTAEASPGTVGYPAQA